VEIYVSHDAANQYAATASCSIPFSVQGFDQALNQVKVTKLKTWLGHTTWTRIKPQDTTYKALMSKNDLKFKFKYAGNRKYTGNRKTKFKYTGNRKTN
jgi:hypothetical protein